MLSLDLLTLCLLILLAATTYSAVGHAGASAYIAAMALYGLAPAVMRPTALVLNILVASFTTYRFYRAGLVNVKSVLPFALGSVPFAFIGGAVQLPGQGYKVLVGLMLLFAAYRLWVSAAQNADAESQSVQAITRAPALAMLVMGAGIGLLSGLTGTGGGIFLSPVLVMKKWATIRQSSGIAAPFILVNSIAGLAGNLSVAKSLPAELPYYLVAAMLGALLGTRLGIQWLPPHLLRRVLALVLLVAALKFMLV
jgi:uncharacterized protein